ncbi:uncharacterized protein [Porites lutea]|uniref:uncharacterized protein n=1 Tax=Porites lutea TaxID=51062 RepID=UPI003CC55CBD
MMVKSGSLIITVQCLTLKSLESLWNDYCSGYLNDIVERFLVTDEIKRKLGMDNVRLKTTIEEEKYLICKKAFLENSEDSLKAGSSLETKCNASQRMEGMTEDHEETSLSSDCEMKADAASGYQTKISPDIDSQSQSSRELKMSGFSCNPGKTPPASKAPQVSKESQASKAPQLAKHLKLAKHLE